ncbi:MAG: DNA polymerase Y family protein, partial [Mesorhizobium sp.]
MISHRDSNAQRIAALDERAEALKLKRGMGIADARAMHPSIDVVEADPEADRRLLEGLADWCDRYTPLVATDGEDGLFLDVTGCTHLFGGERAMQDEILTRFFQQGFDVRAGVE